MQVYNRLHKGGEIAVDLDGTLAHYDVWKGIEHIGDPIPIMKERVLNLAIAGFKVVIFTARANDPEAIQHIELWLAMNSFPPLEITNIKRKEFIEIWDDRAISVERNTGFTLNANAHRQPKKPSKSALDNQVGGGHYKDMKFQPVEFCRANGFLGLESGVVKYVSRHKAKGGAEDINKAIHLLQLILELDYDS